MAECDNPRTLRPSGAVLTPRGSVFTPGALAALPPWLELHQEYTGIFRYPSIRNGLPIPITVKIPTPGSGRGSWVALGQEMEIAVRHSEDYNRIHLSDNPNNDANYNGINLHNQTIMEGNVDCFGIMGTVVIDGKDGGFFQLTPLGKAAPTNDRGRAVAMSTQEDYRYTWYCGRELGVNIIPNGRCGPDNGPQCPSCARFQKDPVTNEERRKRRERAAQKYFVYGCKVIAGFSRLFFEDLLSVPIQFAFLVKCWHYTTLPMKIFNFASMSTGFTLLCFGIFSDLRNMREARHRATAAEVIQERIQAEIQRTSKTLIDVPKSGDTAGGRGGDAGAKSKLQGGIAAACPRAGTRQATAPLGDTWTPKLHRGSVLDYIEKGPDRRGKFAHGLLLASAVVYWSSVVVEGLLTLGSSTDGAGTVASVPVSAFFVFSTVTVFSVLTELWIAIHVESGLKLILDADLDLSLRKLWRGDKDTRQEANALFAMFISFLGRFDTFSDTVFVCVLTKSEPIEYLRLDSMGGTEIHLPLPLHTMAQLSLLIGVFCLQALPGLFCVATKKFLAAGFKFNEFNFLLGLLEYTQIECCWSPAGVLVSERGAEVCACQPCACLQGLLPGRQLRKSPKRMDSE